ncbi:MAG: glycosyltransferase [Polyangiaceae bacterium]
MRIAVLSSSFPSHEGDPSGHFVRSEVRALSAEHHAVFLFVPKGSEIPNVDHVSGVQLSHLGLFGWPGALERIRRHPWRLLGLFPFAFLARRELRRHGPYDALIAHWIVPGFWPIARDYAGSVTAVAHGSDVRLLERLPAQLTRRVVTALLRSNVTVRCVSSELAARLSRICERHHGPLERVYVEPCAFEVPELPRREELRRVLGGADAPLVVVVGRAVKTKRIEVAIAATRCALGVDPVVIGDGPERAPLAAQFPHTTFLGQLSRDATLRWIRAADILVSASELEGAPTVVREARALGTPVVAVAAGDLRDWAGRDPEIVVVPTEAELGSTKRQIEALARRIRNKVEHARRDAPARPVLTGCDPTAFAPPASSSGGVDGSADALVIGEE